MFSSQSNIIAGLRKFNGNDQRNVKLGWKMKTKVYWPQKKTYICKLPALFFYV